MCVPVRMPDGTTRRSIRALAAELGCSHSALYAHIVDHRDGHAILATLPSPRNVGRRGGGMARRFWQLPSPYAAAD